MERAKIGTSTKKCEKGEGKGGKEKLARKPHDFEKPVRPRTEFSDWRGMVVLIAKRQIRQSNQVCSFERVPHEHNELVNFLVLSCMTFTHQLIITIFLPEVPLQLVNHRCSGLTQEDHFCPDPTADLKDLREAFSDREESTRALLKQGLLPDGVWSSCLHKLIDCFGGVWETADSLPIAFRITSNNAPKFRFFECKNCTGTRSENSSKF